MARLLKLKKVVLSPLGISISLHLVLAFLMNYSRETKEIVAGSYGGVIMAMVVHEETESQLKVPELNDDLLPQQSTLPERAAVANPKPSITVPPVSDRENINKKVVTKIPADESAKRASSSVGGATAPGKTKGSLDKGSLDKGSAALQRGGRSAEEKGGKAEPFSKQTGDRATQNNKRVADRDSGGATRRSMGMGGGLATPYECNQYAAQIKLAIEGHMIADSSYHGRSCEVALQIGEDGLILRADPLRGDRMVCRAAMRAIGVAGSLPRPPNSRVYESFKDIVISFNM